MQRTSKTKVKINSLNIIIQIFYFFIIKISNILEDNFSEKTLSATNVEKEDTLKKNAEMKDQIQDQFQDQDLLVKDQEADQYQNQEEEIDLQANLIQEDHIQEIETEEDQEEEVFLQVIQDLNQEVILRIKEINLKTEIEMKMET